MKGLRVRKFQGLSGLRIQGAFIASSAGTVDRTPCYLYGSMNLRFSIATAIAHFVQGPKNVGGLNSWAWEVLEVEDRLGSFRKLGGVPHFWGSLMIRILLFRVLYYY